MLIESYCYIGHYGGNFDINVIHNSAGYFAKKINLQDTNMMCLKASADVKISTVLEKNWG